jgi:hypothetical protein
MATMVPMADRSEVREDGNDNASDPTSEGNALQGRS